MRRPWRSERGDAGVVAMIGLWLILAVVGVGVKQHTDDLTRCAQEASQGADLERQQHCWNEYGVFVPPKQKARK